VLSLLNNELLRRHADTKFNANALGILVISHVTGLTELTQAVKRTSVHQQIITFFIRKSFDTIQLDFLGVRWLPNGATSLNTN
jgi:hypothetical protein